MATGEVIRRERERRGWSQTVLAERLAAASGGKVTQKDISRWESGQYLPDILESVALLDLFQIGIDELAGRTRSGVDLSGDWWAAWQTWGDDQAERVDVHELAIRQDGPILSLDGARARPVSEGSYAWDGEFRLHEESLIGWYAASDGAVRSKGAMYFVLHTQGQRMAGGWIGQSQAGLIVRGWGAIARERDECEQLIRALAAHPGNLPEWPKLRNS